MRMAMIRVSRRGCCISMGAGASYILPPSQVRYESKATHSNYLSKKPRFQKRRRIENSLIGDKEWRVVASYICTFLSEVSTLRNGAGRVGFWGFRVQPERSQGFGLLWVRAVSTSVATTTGLLPRYLTLVDMVHEMDFRGEHWQYNSYILHVTESSHT